MLNFEQMIIIRDGIVAKNQHLHFHEDMCNYLYDRYLYLWKFGERISSELDMSYDRSRRKWLGHHPKLSSPVVFDKKPTPNQKVLQTLWKISKEVSKGNPNFATVLHLTDIC